MNEALTAFLRHMSEFFEPPMCPLERFILECGIDFTPRKRPVGVRKQADKQCFRNTYHLVMAHDDLEYVEGYAVHGDGWPMQHAWAANKEGEAIDPTWRWPEKSAYRGVIIPRETLLLELCKNGVFGVLDLGYRINTELIDTLRNVARAAG